MLRSMARMIRQPGYTHSAHGSRWVVALLTFLCFPAYTSSTNIYTIFARTIAWVVFVRQDRAWWTLTSFARSFSYRAFSITSYFTPRAGTTSLNVYSTATRNQGMFGIPATSTASHTQGKMTHIASTSSGYYFLVARIVSNCSCTTWTELTTVTVTPFTFLPPLNILATSTAIHPPMMTSLFTWRLGCV